MAVAIDGTGSPLIQTSAVGTGFTYTMPAIGSGTNRAAVVAYTFQCTTDIRSSLSAVYDAAGANQTMYSVASSQMTADTQFYVVIFALRNPATSVAKLVTFNWTGGATVEGTAVGCSFSGVNQTSDVAAFTNVQTNNANASPATVSITPAASGNEIFAMGEDAAGQNPSTTGQTQIYVDHSSPNINSWANRLDTTSTSPVSMSCTLGAADNFLYVAFEITQVSAAAVPDAFSTSIFRLQYPLWR